jgi:hypothetical protein
MGLPDSSYTSTCIFPLLDKQSTERRYNWAKAFWIFRNTATSLRQDAQFVLVHMDEKWFYAIVARAYVGHHQMVNAIAQDQGRDDFARKRGGLHCGIRNCCIPYFDSDNSTTPCGVEVVQSLESDINEEMDQKKTQVPDSRCLRTKDGRLP